MEKRRRPGLVLSALTVGIMFSMPTVGHASIPENLGFEDGLTAWTVTENGGGASVVDSYTASYLKSYMQYDPPEGESFLLLTNGTTGKGVSVSRTFDLTEGAILTGYYAFSAPGIVFDFSASIISSNTSFDIISTGSLLNNLLAGPGWQSWEWAAPTSATYTLSYVLYNTPLDGNGRSYAMFDTGVSPAPTPPVPIPGAVLLLGSALLGLLGIGSRKKNVGVV